MLAGANPHLENRNGIDCCDIAKESKIDREVKVFEQCTKMRRVPFLDDADKKLNEITHRIIEGESPYKQAEYVQFGLEGQLDKALYKLELDNRLTVKPDEYERSLESKRVDREQMK